MPTSHVCTTIKQTFLLRSLEQVQRGRRSNRTYSRPGNKGSSATQPSTHMNAIMDNAPTTKRAITVGLDHEKVEPPPLIGTYPSGPSSHRYAAYQYTDRHRQAQERTEPIHLPGFLH